MQFKLRRPCNDCPFRYDRRPFIQPERAQEIAHAVLHDNKTFSCHKTLSGEWEEEDDDGGETDYRPGDGDQMCAGALVLIEKTGAANQMTQIAERLGLWDPSTLDPSSPVYESADEMVEAHRKTDL